MAATKLFNFLNNITTVRIPLQEEGSKGHKASVRSVSDAPLSEPGL